MMKIYNFKKFWYALLMVPIIMITSCKEDPVPVPAEDPVASFQFELDATDWQKVTFTNFSTNAESYAWDFGDGTGTSTDKDPVYTYAEPGTYTVKLTATNAASVAKEQTKNVIIADPLAAQRALIGADGKSWYLIADVSTGVNPIQVGPENRSQIWWSLGGAQDLCVRKCYMDDTWTFNTNATFTYDNNGDYWASGTDYWAATTIDCFDATDAANWVGSDGQDLTDWNSGTHPFVYDVQAATLTITGGFIGLQKVGTDAEVTEPQSSVTYKVIKLIESTAVDTLVLETSLNDGTAYWQFNLVSYHDVADKVIVDECPAPAMVTFELNFNDYIAGGGTATTPEVNGTFNGWCGNCWSMTDDNTDGIWTITKELAVGDYRFKFSADGWGDQEDLTDVTGCTVVNDGNTDRTFTVVSGVDMTIGAVCWASCDDCP